jgi:hypothetical protein
LQAQINYQLREAEMKKILVWFLLVSFINLTGCYSSELLAPRSYKFDEKKDIRIITKDTTYKFKAYQYLLVNDTLSATNKNIRITETTPVESIVKIPVEDMQVVEVTKGEPGKTILAIAGGVAIVVLLIGFVSLTKSHRAITF